MKNIRVLILSVIACIYMVGCGKKEDVDFSNITSISELATLKSYYHNVAELEAESSGILSFTGIGYKKIWIEYSGVVNFGIDMTKIEISQPSEDGTVSVVLPEAEILSLDLDETSFTLPLIDTGVFTKITKEEEIFAVDIAQKTMEEEALANKLLFTQAQQRAQELIEQFIINTGKVLGEDYSVKWENGNF